MIELPMPRLPQNRRSGSLWAIVTAVAILVVLYFMFFSSREGAAPSASGPVAPNETPEAGSRAPVPSGGGTPQSN